MLVGDKFIFVHIPKTGGNSLQSFLFDPEINVKITTAVQDGKDRFGIQDRFTKKKHQFLSEYLKHAELKNFDFVSIVRHPITRMFSRYYSPARHVAPKSRTHEFLNVINNKIPEKWRMESRHLIKYNEPIFDKENFISMMRDTDSQTDFLSVNGKIHDNLSLIRFESYNESAKEVLAKYGISFKPTHVNQGKVNPKISSNLNDELMHEFVTGRHRVDFENFGYEPENF